VSALIAFTLAACDDFFSTSWGEARKYDLSKIKLTSGNLQEWKNKAVGNPELAGKLVEKIIRELDGKSGAEKAAFQDAGVDLAVEQSGIGTTILDIAGKDMDKLVSGGDEDAIKGLLGTVQGKFGAKGYAAAENIAAIAVGSVSGSSFAADDLYAAQVSAADVGMAVAVLALSIMPDINSKGFGKNSLDDSGVSLSGDTFSGSGSKAATFAAYMNLIMKDNTGKFTGNPITSGLKSAFE
jgi:hypothetical protein